MKRYEREALDSLVGDPSHGGELLPTVKNAMGSLSYSKGNPLTKTEISLQISIRYTRRILVPASWVEIVPGLLPANLQTSIPLFLLGLTDFYSGYPKSILNCDAIQPWAIGSLTPGEPSCGIFGYTRSITSLDSIGLASPPLGTMVITLWSFVAPGTFYYAEVFIFCGNVAYGTFLNSFVSDLITINTLRYIVPIANINQFINPLVFGYQTLFGKLYTDNVDPRMFITSTDFQQQVCDIPIDLPIDKNALLLSRINFDCQNISMIFFVERIEPLTNRPKHLR